MVMMKDIMDIEQHAMGLIHDTVDAEFALVAGVVVVVAADDALTAT